MTIIAITLYLLGALIAWGINFHAGLGPFNNVIQTALWPLLIIIAIPIAIWIWIDRMFSR